jgi:hypothetical protein
MPQDNRGRAETLARSRAEKFDSWFATRRWRVCAEVSGLRERDGHKVLYHRGFFKIEPPGVFQTPLGHKGRTGYLVQEVDGEGHDKEGTSPVAFGRRTLEHAINSYAAVTGLPEKDPKRAAGKWIDAGQHVG